MRSNILLAALCLVSSLFFNEYTFAALFTHDGIINTLWVRIALRTLTLGFLATSTLFWVKRRSIDYRRHIRPACILLAIQACMIVAAFEIYARLTPTPPDKQAAILEVENFPAKSQFLADHNRRVALAYHDYHLYSAAPSSSKTINFTDYFCARVSPDSEPQAQADLVVWMFGGSTMMDRQNTDELTLSNQAARRLNELGHRACVWNFGVGSFQSSLESIKFQDLLRRVPKEQRPDVALFYDGYNDGNHGLLFGAGNMQGDLSSKLEAVVERQNINLTAYYISNSISSVSMFWKKFIAPIIDIYFFRRPTNDSSPANLTHSVDIYEANVRMVRAICQEFNIRPIFVLQPMIFTKKPLTRFEQRILASIDPITINYMHSYYDAVRDRMHNAVEFVDLSSVLDGRNHADFQDLGHTGPYTGIPIGQALADLVENALAPPPQHTSQMSTDQK